MLDLEASGIIVDLLAFHFWLWATIVCENHSLFFGSTHSADCEARLSGLLRSRLRI